MKLGDIASQISKYLTEPRGGESSRRLIWFTVAIWCLGMFSAYIPLKGLDDKIVDIIKTLIYVSGGAVVVGRIAEAMDGNENKV
jgi:hypothetical protein